MECRSSGHSSVTAGQLRLSEEDEEPDWTKTERKQVLTRSPQGQHTRQAMAGKRAGLLPFGVIVLVCLATNAEGHCAGEGFPDRQCTGGCGVGSFSPVPNVRTLKTADGLLVTPGGIAVSPDGTYALVSSFGTSTIAKIDLAYCSAGQACPEDSAKVLVGGGEGYQDGKGTNARFMYPAGMDFTSDGRRAFIAEVSLRFADLWKYC